MNHIIFYTKWATILNLVLLAIVLFSGIAKASELNDRTAVLSIIGEAENQGSDGMLALASALRNRGTLKGVYGFKSPRVVKHLYSEATYKKALAAWKKSQEIDTTNGATGWGNSEDLKKFAKTKWWRNCVITVKVKDHFFYKEV